MNLRLQQILTRLSHFKKTPPPGRHEVSRGAGIDIHTVTRLFSIPQTRLSIREFEGLVQYLFKEFRPFIAAEVKDGQLINQLRFELLEFPHDTNSDSTPACPFSSDGKYSLKDLS